MKWHPLQHKTNRINSMHPDSVQNIVAPVAMAACRHCCTAQNNKAKATFLHLPFSEAHLCPHTHQRPDPAHHGTLLHTDIHIGIKQIQRDTGIDKKTPKRFHDI